MFGIDSNGTNWVKARLFIWKKFLEMCTYISNKNVVYKITIFWNKRYKTTIDGYYFNTFVLSSPNYSIQNHTQSFPRSISIKVNCVVLPDGSDGRAGTNHSLFTTVWQEFFIWVALYKSRQVESPRGPFDICLSVLRTKRMKYLILIKYKRASQMC